MKVSEGSAWSDFEKRSFVKKFRKKCWFCCQQGFLRWTHNGMNWNISSKYCVNWTNCVFDSCKGYIQSLALILRFLSWFLEVTLPFSSLSVSPFDSWSYLAVSRWCSSFFFISNQSTQSESVLRPKSAVKLGQLTVAVFCLLQRDWGNVIEVVSVLGGEKTS